MKKQNLNISRYTWLFGLTCFYALGLANPISPNAIVHPSIPTVFENYTDSIIRIFDQKTGHKLRLYYSIDWPTDGSDEWRTDLKRALFRKIDSENEYAINKADSIDLPSFFKSFFEKWYEESQSEDWYGEDLHTYETKADFTDDEFLDFEVSSYSRLYMQNGVNPPNKASFRIRLKDGASFSGYPFQKDTGYQIYSLLGGMALLDPELRQFETNDLFADDGVHPERFFNEDIRLFFTKDGICFNFGMGALGFPMAAGEISFEVPYKLLIPILTEEARQFVPSRYVQEYERNKETLSELEKIIFSLCFDSDAMMEKEASRAQYNPLMLMAFHYKGIDSSLSVDEVMSAQLKKLHEQIDGVVDNYVRKHPRWYERYAFDYPSLFLYLLPEKGWPDPVNEFCVITGYDIISPEKVKIRIANQCGPETIEFVKENGKWKINDVDNLQYDMRQTIKDPTYWLKRDL